MKTVRFSLIAMAAVLFVLGLSPAAQAFHDGGVAHCDGCHAMHNSQDGVEVTDTPGDYLQKGSDPSSTCLACHASYGQQAGGFGYGSGGDFYWLTKTFTWVSHGAKESTGDSHGHNIIALDNDLTSNDAVLGLTPPGAMGALDSELACSSCHDPHGKDGNPLLLWGIGDTRGDKVFTSAAPVIESPGRRTTASGNPVSDTEHTAFGSGMSDWCANCHTDFLDGEAMHPADEGLGSTIATNYNKYVSTDVIDAGNGPISYWEAVPFETGEAQDVLDTGRTAGPTSASKVMCLSCHRAHASAFPDAGRWDFTATFIVEDSHPLTGDGNASADDVTNKYYGRVYTDEQRSLCG